MSVLLGNGDGTFRAKVDYPTGRAPVSLVVKDIDHDGKLDLAVTRSGLNERGDLGAMVALLGNGDGTFHVVHDYAPLAPPARPTLVGGDGQLDLVMSYFLPSTSISFIAVDRCFP